MVMFFYMQDITKILNEKKEINFENGRFKNYSGDDERKRYIRNTSNKVVSLREEFKNSEIKEKRSSSSTELKEEEIKA